MKLWIVGKSLGEPDLWQFQGVYDSEEKALLACRTPNYCVAPAVLNQELPDETVEWVGLYYPFSKPQVTA